MNRDTLFSLLLMTGGLCIGFGLGQMSAPKTKVIIQKPQIDPFICPISKKPHVWEPAGEGYKCMKCLAWDRLRQLNP